MTHARPARAGESESESESAVGCARPVFFFPSLNLLPSLSPSLPQQEVKTADATPEPPSEAAAAEASASEAAPPKKAAAPAPAPVVPEGKEQIYIGFEKGDYAPRSGRTGRVIVDDPAKYPDRTVYVGGWPGGEVALKSWAPKAAADAGGGAEAAPSGAGAAKAPSIPKPTKGGAAPIYLGHAKDDYTGRREGVPGRFIVDDPTKYPGREDVGPLISAVGGFAGGEVGVKAFAATGKVPVTDADAPARRQFSPVAILFVVAGAAGLGGALLNSGVEVAEGVVEGLEGAAVASGGGSGAAAAGAAAAAGRALLDPGTRTLLAVGGGLLALTGGIFGVRAAVMAARDRAAAAAETIGEGAKAAAFWVAVFLAFKLVLEST